MSRTDVSIRKFSPSGRMVEHRFNPFWTRFLVRRHSEIGVVSMHVRDRSQHTDVGSFLNPEDRESFAKAFKRRFGNGDATDISVHARNGWF